MSTMTRRIRRKEVRRRNVRAGVVAALALTAVTAVSGSPAFAAEPSPAEPGSSTVAGNSAPAEDSGPAEDAPAAENSAVTAGNVTAKGVPFRTAVPGENGLPAVKITNNGNETVTSVDIKTVTLDSWALSWPYTEIRSDKDGSLVKRCSLDTGNKKIMKCGKVTLNIPPKGSVKLRTEVSTDERLKAGELPRTVWNVNGEDVTAELTMVDGRAVRGGGG
jgi:hypothetical protein